MFEKGDFIVSRDNPKLIKEITHECAWCDCYYVRNWYYEANKLTCTDMQQYEYGKEYLEQNYQYYKTENKEETTC